PDVETGGGVRVTRIAGPFDPGLLAGIAQAVDDRRGGVLSSGMEYPGRYSRWHIAYADPCVAIVARGRPIGARALNARGRVLLPVIGAALQRAGTPVPDLGAPADDLALDVAVDIAEPDRAYTEEERSRRPTVFSALREVIAAFGCDDPNLGLYGAFGYDLAFQFEPVRMRLDRPASQRDLVLHLPDEVYVLDRKREQATRFRYEFTVGGASTEGLARLTERTTPPVAPPLAELPEQPKPGAYAQVVAQAREKFARGDLFEVVPGHVFYGRCARPAAFYEQLRHRNPAPYEFMFNLGQGENLVGPLP